MTKDNVKEIAKWLGDNNCPCGRHFLFREKDNVAIFNIKTYYDSQIKYGELSADDIAKWTKQYEDLAAKLATTFGVTAELKTVRYQGFINDIKIYVR